MYKNTGIGIQERETKCGERGEWGECYIPENVAKHSGKYPQTFLGMSLNISGNVAKHSGECCQFRGMSSNICGNIVKYSSKCRQAFWGDFFSYFNQSRVFYTQLIFRSLIQPDFKSRFIVRSQFGPSIQSGSSLSDGLQVVAPSSHLLKDCYPRLVSHQHCSEIRPLNQLDYRCTPLQLQYWCMPLQCLCQAFWGMSVLPKKMGTLGQSNISWNLLYRIMHVICNHRLIDNEAAEARPSYK